MSEIVIKSVSCIIPGYTDPEEGELIPTEEILSNIEKLDVNNIVTKEIIQLLCKEKARN